MRRVSEKEFTAQFFGTRELDEVVQSAAPGAFFTAKIARVLGETVEITGGKRNGFLSAGNYVLRVREPEVVALAEEWAENGMPDTLPEPQDRTDEEREALGDDPWSCAGANTLRPTVSVQITDEDRAAARLAGMSTEEYMLYRDTYPVKGGGR